MIPKVIHYCWFGGNELPESAKKYIKTWHEILPDYEIKEWNESSFDIQNAPIYVSEAYNARKYAFVSDYVRIKVLLDYGGIYFDTDVEVVRSFESFLSGRSMVLGFESDRLLTTAFIACCKNHPFIKEFENSYHSRRFIKDDGSMDYTVINDHFSKLAEKWGVDLSKNEFQLINNEIAIYPIEYFAAFDVKNWHEKVTANTYTIHHMNASWVDGKKRLYFAVIKFLQKILGYKNYDRFKRWYKKIIK